jgi:integrase
MRLTDISIRALKPPAKGEQIHYCDTLKGFGVRVSEGGTKSYILTHGRRRARETLGRVGVISLSEARGEAKRRLAEYTLGKHQPKAKSWATAVSEFLAEPRKPRTQKDYKRHLAVHFPYGDTRLFEIGAHDLQKDLDKLSKTPGEREHAFVVLRAFIRYCYRKHYMDKNPMGRMAVPRHSQPRARILIEEELVKVWKASGDDAYGKIVKLLILTGQRRGEITQLNSDMVHGDLLVLPPWLCKNSREHRLPLGSLSRSILPNRPKSSLLFPAKTSKSSKASKSSPTCFNGFSKSKAALDQRSGVADWTLHDLRRTFASGLQKLNVRSDVIEQLLNHTPPGIKGVYQRHEFAKEKRAAMDVWEAYIQKLL